MGSETVYCTVDDVQRFVKRKVFSDVTTFTIQDVESTIDQISAVVDAELATLGYSIPISSSARQSRRILTLLVAYEVASIAENSVFFSANKDESTHGQYLHQQYLDLFDKIKTNPKMLPDISRGSVTYIQSSTESMNKGGVDHNKEIFTSEHIDDFVEMNKIISPSEEAPEGAGVITGRIPNKI